MGTHIDNDGRITFHDGPPARPTPPAGWRYRFEDPDRRTIEREDDPDSYVALNDRGNVFIGGKIAKTTLKRPIRGIRPTWVIGDELVQAIAFLVRITT